MDSSLRPNPQNIVRKGQTKQMESHRSTNGPIVPSSSSDRQTVPLAVLFYLFSYNNHLNPFFAKEAWTSDEEQKLFRLHD